jgi:N-acetylmuramoyl-L-alanine amidase
MFFVSSKKLVSTLLIVALFTIIFNVPFLQLNKKNVFAVSNNITIVIDAGHGGKDVGTSGTVTGVFESDLNLIFSKKLEEYFAALGFRVIQTRKTKEALYVGANGFIKKKDMEVRRNIIEKAEPDMVISIHMNDYKADPSQCGAQTFYNAENEQSKKLSDLIQKELNKVNIKQKVNLAGDYYILNSSSAPSALVECGFLSNPNEEALLQDEEYQNKITYAIFSGAVAYFYSTNN